VTDPVCGMEIDTAAAAASEEYQGKTYYFCSEGCHQRFCGRAGAVRRLSGRSGQRIVLPAQAGVGDQAALVFCQ